MNDQRPDLDRAAMLPRETWRHRARRTQSRGTRNDDGAALPSFYGEDFFCYWRVKGVFDAWKSACGLGSCLTQGSAVFFAEGLQKNRQAAVGASWARMEHCLRARNWGAIAGHAGQIDSADAGLGKGAR